MRFIPFFELFYLDDNDKRERTILYDNLFPLNICKLTD